jgi:RNA polymerase sigma factor (sigma-70 family)
VEVSSLKIQGSSGLRGPTQLLRLQGDERLVALTRRGNQAAYEALVARYQSRLLAFCRHMLSSREDAEDVLQEVFAAAFNAMLADDRQINVRPWLYRIARNRCLNHLRKQTAIGVDSMDIHLAENGTTTADKVHDREDFRELIADVQTLAETQRTALLLREIDALSYEQIAEAMETTVPSVKSLLVRARVSLAEAAEARKLSCDEVRGELGEWAEGLARISAPARRHVRDCQRCSMFKKQLKETNKALAAVFPVGPLLLLKKFILAQGASSASAAASGAAATGGATVGGATAGGALSAGIGVVATKAAAGLAAVAIVTTGAVEVDHVKHRHVRSQGLQASAATQTAAKPRATLVPVAVRSTPQKSTVAKQSPLAAHDATAKPKAAVPPAEPSTALPANPPAGSATAPVPASTTAPGGTQQGYDSTRLPDPADDTTTDPPVTLVTDDVPSDSAPATDAPETDEASVDTSSSTDASTTLPDGAASAPAESSPSTDPTASTPVPPTTVPATPATPSSPSLPAESSPAPASTTTP